MWKSDEVVQATKGALHGPAFTASSVSIDSRKLEPGALFVALKGDRVDGHDYVKEAFAKGASAALIQRIVPGISEKTSMVVVQDTGKALIDLATHARARAQAKIIAVTGSVGKTGTKEALRVALKDAGSVYATQGNLNNHIGLPLSLAGMSESARFGVFELGMNHVGEISYLARIVRPDIAIITNVEAVHLEFFPNVEAIADAKAEIMEGMKEDGTIILNRDNRFYNRLRGHAEKRGIKHIVTFGAHKEAQCRLVSYALADSGSQVEAVIHGKEVTYRMGAIGRHYAIASLAALAASVAAGANPARAASALAGFHEPDGRGKVQHIARGKGSITLIDDCYNASPSSMIAGVGKLEELHSGLGGKGRKIAVLGDMLELGVAAPALHKELLTALQHYGIDKVYASGALMKHLYDILPAAMQGAYTMNALALAPIVYGALQENDVVLVKGSHGSRMDIVRDALIKSSRHTPKEKANAV